MAIALAIIGAIYLGIEALLVLFAASSLADLDILAFLSGLLFVVMLPFVLVMQIRHSGSLALRTTGAEVVPPGREHQLEALAERVAAYASLPAPRLAIVDTATPNAFAVGTTAGKSVVTLTRGLVQQLTNEEIEAVLAHELTHVANRDRAVMTFASGPAMAGSGLWRDSDWLHKASLLLFAPLWGPIYLLSLLLAWSISRYREYVADRGSGSQARPSS